MRTALEVFERGLVRRDHAGAGARLDGHVAHGHAFVHREVADRLAAAEIPDLLLDAAVFDDVALTAAGADLRDDRQNNVLGGGVRRQLAVHVDRHRLERLEAQRLRRHHVLDLGGADAERERAERAVRGRVGVAAHDGHARLGQAQNRGERVDDALISVAQRVQAHAELLAVLFQRAQLQGGCLVRVRAVDVDRRRVVILCGDQLIDVTRLAPGQT